MRFTGTIVANEQDALVIYHIIQLQLRNNLGANQFSHIVAHNIAADQFFRFFLIICTTQNNDRLNGVELNKVTIFHGRTLLNHKQDKYLYIL